MVVPNSPRRGQFRASFTCLQCDAACIGPLKRLHHVQGWRAAEGGATAAGTLRLRLPRCGDPFPAIDSRHGSVAEPDAWRCGRPRRAALDRRTYGCRADMYWPLQIAAQSCRTAA